jgi:hypothetical protein
VNSRELNIAILVIAILTSGRFSATDVRRRSRERIIFGQPLHAVARQRPHARDQPLRKRRRFPTNRLAGATPFPSYRLRKKHVIFFVPQPRRGRGVKASQLGSTNCVEGGAKLLLFLFSWGFPPNPHLPFGEGGLDKRVLKYLYTVYYYQGGTPWTPPSPAALSVLKSKSNYLIIHFQGRLPRFLYLVHGYLYNTIHNLTTTGCSCEQRPTPDLASYPSPHA